jgi:hypothetical protein
VDVIGHHAIRGHLDTQIRASEINRSNDANNIG